MKIILALGLLATGMMDHNENPAVSTLRQLYHAATLEKDSALKLDKLLLGVNHSSPPILICYKGVSEMLLAKYASNPFSKYSKFKIGRALIESAIELDTADVEMRFLRYTIQTNIPWFLDYTNHLGEDKAFLLGKICDLKDLMLKQLIADFLRSSGYLKQKDEKCKYRINDPLAI